MLGGPWPASAEGPLHKEKHSPAGENLGRSQLGKAGVSEPTSSLQSRNHKPILPSVRLHRCGPFASRRFWSSPRSLGSPGATLGKCTTHIAGCVPLLSFTNRPGVVLDITVPFLSSLSPAAPSGRMSLIKNSQNRDPRYNTGDRDYMGWMDFGRRSIEEYEYPS